MSVTGTINLYANFKETDLVRLFKYYETPYHIHCFLRSGFVVIMMANRSKDMWPYYNDNEELNGAYFKLSKGDWDFMNNQKLEDKCKWVEEIIESLTDKFELLEALE